MTLNKFFKIICVDSFFAVQKLFRKGCREFGHPGVVGPVLMFDDCKARPVSTVTPCFNKMAWQ
jgi:hypothetical protein